MAEPDAQTLVYPTLDCTCKAKRCPVEGCWKCSRCGCNHDGVEPDVAVERRRGRQRRADTDDQPADGTKRLRVADGVQPTRILPGRYAGTVARSLIRADVRRRLLGRAGS